MPLRPALIIIIAAMLALSSGCGGSNPNLISPEHDAGLRATAELPPQLSPSTGVVHRAATWQDTRGFVPGVDYYPDQILVLFAEKLAEGSVTAGAGAGQPQINHASMLYANAEHAQFARQLAETYGLLIPESCEAYVRGFNYCTYQLPPGVDAEALMQRILDENPHNVRLVEYNPIYRPLYTPDDPKVQDNTQWFHNASHMDNYGAWDTQTGSADVYIAIIDTGADMDHPDLEANILDIQTLWPDEDFDLGEPDKWPQDNGSHGSHCCGIAAAVGDNATGGAGVAYDAGILPIKVTNASGAFVGSISGIVLAVECGAAVISMSFGSYLPSNTTKEACEYAYMNGTMPVAAAGNDNNGAQTHFPAGVPVCIAVGAVKSSDDKAGFSNYGPWIDSVAPGVSIYSTVPNNTYATYQGTSMASPMVAGAVALLISEFGDTLDLDQMRGLLELNGGPVSDSQWRNSYVTRVNTANALGATPGTAPVVDITNLTSDQNVSGEIAIDCTVTDDGVIERAFLYIDGIFVDEMYDPGSDFTFVFDLTDEYPGETNILVEVIDDDFIHGFDERTVIVTDSFFMPAPYFNDFDSGDLSHWTQYNISGEAYWHLYEEAPGDFALRLGDPALSPPKYRQRDVDWLYSPLFDLRNVEKARLTFDGDWSFASTKPMYVYVYWENSGGFLNIYDAPYGYTYDGEVSFSLNSIVGHVVQFFWMLEGDDSGGQRWFSLDDFYLQAPTLLPWVLFDFPREGATVDGVVDLKMNVYDDFVWQIDRLEVFVDGAPHATAHYPDWDTTLDTAPLPNGPITISATAYEYDEYDNDGDGETEDTVTKELHLFVGHHAVTSIAPTEGFYYDEVVISGSGFGDFGEGETRVTFAGAGDRLEAPVVSWEDSAITVTVPVGAATGRLQVDISGAVRESAETFTVFTPFDDFGFAFEDAPEDLMFIDDFIVRIFAQPDMDSVTVRIAGAPGKEWSLGTAGNTNDILMEVSIAGLSTGAYTLEIEGFVGTYSETISDVFYLNTLPGDFNSDGVVDDGDAEFLEAHLAVNGGEIAAGAPGFMPFLDTNADGLVNENDATLVGYRFGDVLE